MFYNQQLKITLLCFITKQCFSKNRAHSFENFLHRMTKEDRGKNNNLHLSRILSTYLLLQIAVKFCPQVLLKHLTVRIGSSLPSHCIFRVISCFF